MTVGWERVTQPEHGTHGRRITVYWRLTNNRGNIKHEGDGTWSARVFGATPAIFYRDRRIIGSFPSWQAARKAVEEALR